VLDADGGIRDANAQAAACFGLTQEQLLETPLAELVRDSEKLTAALRASGADGRWSAEVEGHRADGVPFPLDVSGRVIDAGPPRRALAILRDRNVARDLTSLAQRHFDAAFDASPIGMALYNTDGRFVRVNDAMCRLLGREAEALEGVRDQELTHPDDRQTDLDAARRVLAGDIATFQTEKRFLRPGGEVVWAIANLTFLRDEAGRPISWLGQFQDITEHRRLATCDTLTDLANRRHLEHALAERLRHEARYPPAGALIVMDLDGFKAVNDGFGHHAGDEVLVGVADALRGRLRDTDLVARLGGDEFAVLLPHTSAGEAEDLGRALVALVGALRLPFEPQRALVTASVGVTPLDGTCADLVLAAADRAMYEAKRQGGDACVVSGSTARDRVPRDGGEPGEEPVRR